MTIFQAKEYDPKLDQQKKLYAICALVLVILLGFLVYHFWNWREEHTVDKFLTAIEHKDFQKAYGVWNADPDWAQHPQKYSGYNYGTFELDWGPTGEYGEIHSHRIRQSMTPRRSSGVVVVAMINDRKEPLALWVERKDHSITFLPPTLNIRIEP